jgi:hypothetical protein
VRQKIIITSSSQNREFSHTSNLSNKDIYRIIALKLPSLVITSSEVNTTIEDNSLIVHYGPPAPQKDNLIFDVEFEFALATAPESGVDPEPHLSCQILNMQNEESALEHIHDTLKIIFNLSRDTMLWGC